MCVCFQLGRLGSIDCGLCVPTFTIVTLSSLLNLPAARSRSLKPDEVLLHDIVMIG